MNQYKFSSILPQQLKKQLIQFLSYTEFSTKLYLQVLYKFCDKIIYILMLCSKKALNGHEENAPKRLVSVKSLTNIRSKSNITQETPPRSKNFQKYEVIVQNQNLDIQIQLVDWRSKTQFPIVKILFYKILHKKMLNQCPVIQVAIENFITTLYSLPKMPLFQIFYLMKESIVGFQRLLDQFGTFHINSKMVLINKNKKCRVWMNQNITLNYPSRKAKMAELQFKNQIIRIFEQKCIKSFLSIQFFKVAYGVKTTLKLIQYIQHFIKINKIIPSNQFILITQSIGNKISQNHNEARSELSLTLKKIPKFIQEMRAAKRFEDNNQSKSFDMHNSRKNIPEKRDLSHKKIKKEMSYKSDTTSISVLTPKSYTSNQGKQESFTPQKSKKGGESQININLCNIQNISKTTAPAKRFPLDKRQKKKEQDYKVYVKKFINLLSNGEDNLTQNKVNPQKINLNNQQKTIPRSNTLQIPQIQLGRRKGQLDIKDLILKKIPEIRIAQFEKQDIFNKNGWLKRFNSLTVDKFRQTIHSHVDGNDTLSDQLKFSDIDLGILGAMGKELRGSIFLNPQQR